MFWKDNSQKIRSSQRANQNSPFHLVFHLIVTLIIRCFVFFLFIGQDSTNWSANINANHFLLMRNYNHAVVWRWQIASLITNQINNIRDRMKTQLLNSVIAKKKWFVSVWQINYLPQPSALANNWSTRRLIYITLYFPQPGPIIVKYCQDHMPNIFVAMEIYSSISKNIFFKKFVNHLFSRGEKVSEATTVIWT